MNVRGARAAGGGDKGEAAQASAVSPRPLVPSLIPSDGGVSRLLPLAAPLVQTVEPEEPPSLTHTCTCAHTLWHTQILIIAPDPQGSLYRGKLSSSDTH